MTNRLWPDEFASRLYTDDRFNMQDDHGPPQVPHELSMMMTTTTVTCGLVVKRPSFTFTPLKYPRLRNREKTSKGNESPETVTMKGHRFIIKSSHSIKIASVLLH